MIVATILHDEGTDRSIAHILDHLLSSTLHKGHNNLSLYIISCCPPKSFGCIGPYWLIQANADVSDDFLFIGSALADKANISSDILLVNILILDFASTLTTSFQNSQSPSSAQQLTLALPQLVDQGA